MNVASIIQMFLTMVEALLPQIGVNSNVVDTILSTLIQLVPIIDQEARDIEPLVTNVIAALRNDPSTTAAQLATLDELDAKFDAAFDKAADDYLAAHPDVASA